VKRRTRLPHVVSVEVLAPYGLRLAFDDGLVREVDLTDTLWGPVFEPLKDPTVFASVHVDEELGTVVWPNGADLDPLVLHGDYEPMAATDTRRKALGS
jgi:hypothetical protein